MLRQHLSPASTYLKRYLLFMSTLCGLSEEGSLFIQICALMEGLPSISVSFLDILLQLFYVVI